MNYAEEVRGGKINMWTPEGIKSRTGICQLLVSPLKHQSTSGKVRSQKDEGGNKIEICNKTTRSALVLQCCLWPHHHTPSSSTLRHRVRAQYAWRSIPIIVGCYLEIHSYGYVHQAVPTALLKDFKLPQNNLCLKASLPQSQILIFVNISTFF